MERNGKHSQLRNLTPLSEDAFTSAIQSERIQLSAREILEKRAMEYFAFTREHPLFYSRHRSCECRL